MLEYNMEANQGQLSYQETQTSLVPTSCCKSERSCKERTDSGVDHVLGSWSLELDLKSFNLSLEGGHMETDIRTVIIIKINDEVEKVGPRLCHILFWQ